MLKKRTLIIGAVLLICLTLLFYYRQYTTLHYAVTPQIAAEIEIPFPPAPGSPEERADIAAMLEIQANSTPEQIIQAQNDQEISVFRFEDVMGSAFTPDNLPLTTALFARVRHDQHHILQALKRRYDRSRPYVVDPTIQLTVKKPWNAAYPSGHTSFGYSAAALLARMVPEKKEELFDRAADYGHNRVIGGAHYPTDVEAGRIAGLAVATSLMKDPQFREDFAQAKDELRSKLGY